MTEQLYAFGPFVFDTQRRILSRQGSTVAIGQKCVILLETLLRAEGRAVSKSTLMTAAWQTENIEESNLAVQIAALRKCLGRSKSGEDWIATIQRVGYQFVHHGDVNGLPTQDQYASEVLTADEKPSIAILPFSNMSSDPEQTYFSDGVTEDIIVELARWRLLSVRSRSASFRFRSEAADIRQIARELNVRYIVEGSVRRIGERIRINVQLIDAVTSNEVWAEKFDQEFAEIFAVQDQLVRTIVSTLVGRVEVAALERASRKPPASLIAYECVLKGNALPWDDPMGLVEATRLFAKAIELDPGYGFAHAMLAVMHVRNWENELGNSDATLNEAYRLAKRAVELDRDESNCFAILGLVCMFRRSLDVAMQHMRRAVKINPNNQWNAADMGIVLIYVGQPEAALGCFNRVKEIDPYFESPWCWYCIGLANMVLHRYEEALDAFEHLPVRNFRAAAFMASCHARLADMERAAVFVCECLNLRPEFSISHFMLKQPFKNPADAAHLAECLQLAGLPE